jgi:O-antigen biosynthesis protein
LTSWFSFKTILQDDCSSELSTVNWSKLEIDPGKGLAAVYTPYNIVFGGGERYLLSTVAAMQQIGYNVTVLKLSTNVCKTVEDLFNVASGLQVSLTPEKTSLKSIDVVNGLLPPEEYNKYSLFFSLGNAKLPDVEGIGYINFFMNQFPFDLDRDITAAEVHAFSTYDYVLLNSEFSQR